MAYFKIGERPLWDSDMGEVTILKSLGEGTFTSTFLGKWSTKNREIAVKKFTANAETNSLVAGYLSFFLSKNK